jgi:uncharacterized protein YukE
MAMAGNIKVTPEQLQAIAGQLSGGASAGVAQARFHELWAEWQRSSRGIQEALHGISQLMNQASSN